MERMNKTIIKKRMKNVYAIRSFKENKIKIKDLIKYYYRL
jgi:hypothetical protein